MKWWKWLIIALLIIGVAIIIGTCMLCTQAVEEITEQHELTILEHAMTDEWGTPVVIGTARNDKEFTLDTVKVEIKWYAPQGEVLGSSSDYLGTTLEPGETWQFKVKGYGINTGRVTDYKIVSYGYRY